MWSSRSLSPSKETEAADLEALQRPVSLISRLYDVSGVAGRNAIDAEISAIMNWLSPGTLRRG